MPQRGKQRVHVHVRQIAIRRPRLSQPTLVTEMRPQFENQIPPRLRRTLVQQMRQDERPTLPRR